MFFPKPPKSVVNTKPVAMQVVKQHKSGAVDKHVLVEAKPAAPAVAGVAANKAPTDADV